MSSARTATPRLARKASHPPLGAGKSNSSTDSGMRWSAGTIKLAQHLSEPRAVNRSHRSTFRVRHMVGETKRTRVDGIVELRRAIYVCDDALGFGFSANAGVVRLQCQLPIMGSSEHGSRLAAPGRSVARARVVNTTHLSWGMREAVDQNAVEAIRISHLAPHPYSDHNDLAWLQDSVLRWFETFMDWCRVSTSVGSWSQIVEDGPHLLMVINSGANFLGAGGRSVHVNFNTGNALRSDQIMTAARFADRGEGIPLEHALLLSVDELLAVDRRRAVIDAVSALEVALSSQLTAKMLNRNMPQSAVELILKQANGISGLVSMYRDMSGVALPVSKKRIDNEVANIRNLAVHQAKVPTPEEAQIVIRRCRELVDFINPLHI